MVSRMERYVDPRHQPRINACPADNKFVRGFALQCGTPPFFPPRWPSSSTSVIDGSASRERSRRDTNASNPPGDFNARRRNSESGGMLSRNRTNTFPPFFFYSVEELLIGSSIFSGKLRECFFLLYSFKGIGFEGNPSSWKWNWKLRGWEGDEILFGTII